MPIKLPYTDMQQIKSEYLAGRDIHDIVVDTGISASNIKRALAEMGVIYLHWYKTKEENDMLIYLRGKGINTLTQLEKL